MARLPFTKWHALGNAYLLVERADWGPLDPVTVRWLCDVDRGVGSDGVLEIVSHADGEGDVVVWNPDGSTAEMSGNGVRIAACWLAREDARDEVVITTAGRRHHARMLGAGEAELDMGPVTVGEPETVHTAAGSVELVRASVGNPHAIVLRPGATTDDLRRLGPLLESHEAFPQRTNVQLVEPVGPNELRVLVWERGAGETASSGSSATAAAAVAVRQGWCLSPVTAHLPGGDLVVTLAGDDATLLGPAEEICSGEIVAELG